MTSKIYVSALISVVTLHFTGCGASDETSNTNATAPTTVQARETAADPAKIAELNCQLAIKLTFGTVEEVAALLDNGATAEAKNRYGLPVIFMAAERGDIAILEKLIEAGADVNSRIGTTYNDDGQGYTGTADGTPLAYAAAKGRIGAMEVLKRAGANVNGTGLEDTSALYRAAEAGQLQAVQWLLNQGASAGKSQALGIVQTFINPSDNYQQIIALLRQ